MNGEFKKILYQIFDVLEFSEEDKAYALESFKKKFANDFLKSIEGELPSEHREWISENLKNDNPSETKIEEIQNAIQGRYSQSELLERSRKVFKHILDEYIVFMSKGLSFEKTAQLNSIVAAF